MMSANPHLLIIHCVHGKKEPNLSHQQVLKERLLLDQQISLLAKEDADNGENDGKNNSINASLISWELANKYYEAELDVLMLDFQGTNHGQFRKFLKKCQALQSAEACVVYWPSGSRFYLDEEEEEDEDEDGIDFLQEWETMQTRLWVLDNFESEQQEQTLQQWCLKQGMELIDLSYTDQTSDNEEEDVDTFFSENGQKRVVAALHAHQWSCMKLRGQDRKSRAKDDKAKDAEAEDVEAHDVEDLAGGDFENLLGQLMDMRTRADNLQGDQRRKYAEDVVSAFWKAMGGDPSELLEDEDD